MRAESIIIILVVIYLVLQLIYSGFYFIKAKELVTKTYVGRFESGEIKNPDFSLYVAGDSVGAGVGASNFESSVVGRITNELSQSYHVVTVNNSASGNKIKDLESDLPEDKYDLVILIVGSNDLFHFTNTSDFRKDLGKVLVSYSKKADRVIIVGPGRVFDASAIPLVVRPVYKILGNSYAKILSEEAGKVNNVVHINPLEPKSVSNTYGKTSATDNFHPNDNGHEFWFDIIKPALLTY